MALPAFRTIYVGSREAASSKSTNGGSHFVAVENSIRGCSSLVVDPNDPERDLRGKAKSTDGGETWNFQAGGGGVVLVMDPANPNVLYGLGGEILKTIDAGADLVLGRERRVSAPVFPRDQPVRHGCAVRRHPRRRRVQVPRRRSQLDPDRHRFDCVWRLLVDPTNGNIVYAGTNGNGVYKSIDGGASFVRVGSPKRGIVFSLAKSGDKLYAATDVGGVSR